MDMASFMTAVSLVTVVYAVTLNPARPNLDFTRLPFLLYVLSAFPELIEEYKSTITCFLYELS